MRKQSLPHMIGASPRIQSSAQLKDGTKLNLIVTRIHMEPLTTKIKATGTSLAVDYFVAREVTSTNLLMGAFTGTKRLRWLREFSVTCSKGCRFSPASTVNIRL